MKKQQFLPGKASGLFVTVLMCLFSGMILADEVTGLTTFVSDTPAVAEEVNGNFDAVKSAVDDNNARISTLEESQPPSTGAASFSAFAFSEWRANTSDSTACQLRRLQNYAYFDVALSLGSGCAVTAPVHLPHGATVTGVSCLVVDDISGSTSDTFFYPVSLRRIDLATASTDVIYSTTTTSSNSGLQTLEALFEGGGLDAVVDNESYAYTLMVDFTFADDIATGTSLKLHGCKVTYDAP